MTPSIDEVSGKARYFKTSSIFLHGGIKRQMSHFCDTIYCVCHSFVTLHTEFVTKIRQHFLQKVIKKTSVITNALNNNFAFQNSKLP